ncbi:MAG: PIG-L family deacetylase [Anaerolineales bacterium]
MTTELLVILAHPDDEFGISGTMATLAAKGQHVVLVSATRGEVGEISNDTLASRETLGSVREAELRAACAVLGVTDVRFLGYRDSGMEGTPENTDPRCLVQAAPHAVVGRIVSLIRVLRPRNVVTFEPYGIYGHPDHIAISRHATAAFGAAADATQYPDAGPPWVAARLFHIALPSRVFADWRAALEAAGEDASGLEAFESVREHSVDDLITHELDVSERTALKYEAMLQHRTQLVVSQHEIDG